MFFISPTSIIMFSLIACLLNIFLWHVFWPHHQMYNQSISSRSLTFFSAVFLFLLRKSSFLRFSLSPLPFLTPLFLLLFHFFLLRCKYLLFTIKLSCCVSMYQTWECYATMHGPLKFPSLSKSLTSWWPPTLLQVYVFLTLQPNWLINAYELFFFFFSYLWQKPEKSLYILFIFPSNTTILNTLLCNIFYSLI